MEINRYNRPKLARNKYGYTGQAGDTNSVNISSSSGGGYTKQLTDEQVAFLVALMEKMTIGTDDITVTGNIFATEDITAYTTDTGDSD